MVMDWRTARHLGAESAESYDGTRREARLPELTGGQLQAFIAVGESGAPHKQAWRTLEAYRDGDRDTARAPEEIGRASCRERGEMLVGGLAVDNNYQNEQ